MTEIPLEISCSLTPGDMARRRSEVLAPLSRAVRRIAETEDGWILSFDGSAGEIRMLAGVMELERECCRFLRFELTAEPGEGPCHLKITGPPGAKEAIAAELGL